jgi:pentatricopeptide repeat protein
MIDQRKIITNAKSGAKIDKKLIAVVDETQRAIKKIFLEKNTTPEDALTVASSICGMVIFAACKNKDLEVARQIIELMKTSILDGLSADGWE